MALKMKKRRRMALKSRAVAVKMSPDGTQNVARRHSMKNAVKNTVKIMDEEHKR